MGYYYGIDIYYIILVLPAIILAFWAQTKVNSTFKKYSKVATGRNITGAAAAESILRANGITNVRVERVSGNLTDHYDPKTNVIRLSDSVHSSTSVAAVGVAAHEAGHAVQYAKGYFPIKVRTAILPVCNIGSMLSWPLVLIGLLFNSSYLANLGIIFFIIATLFQVVTLPVEFNASSRALAALSSNWILGNEELKGAKRVLSAAAMTYVAALAVSLAQLLRLVLIVGGRDRD